MCPGHVANAAGLFEPNKFVSFAQGIVNLVVSIILGKLLGILGVFIGTIISGLVPSLCRPIIVYKYYFQETPKEYFTGYILNLLLVLATSTAIGLTLTWVHIHYSWVTLIVLAVLVFIVSNLIFILVYHRKWEYAELKIRITALLVKLRRRS